MAFLYNTTLRRIALTLITVWSIGSFWFFNDINAINVIISIAGLFILYSIFMEVSELFILIFLSFTTTFAFYGFLFLFNLPIWLVMAGSLLIFIYLFAYFDQKRAYLKRERSIFIVLYGLILAETFLLSSYLLISPFNRSAIIMIVTYVITGFSIEIIGQKSFKNFLPYVYFMLAGFVLLLGSAVWSGI